MIEIERERVLSGLHCRGQDLMIDPPACDGCRYQVQMVNRMGCDFRRLCRDSIDLLKEQEAEIRQLRLALDIAKGTCKGVVCETDEKFMGDL